MGCSSSAPHKSTNSSSSSSSSSTSIHSHSNANSSTSNSLSTATISTTTTTAPSKSSLAVMKLPTSSPPQQPRPKLNPKDFILSKLRDTTVIRLPGTLLGQQFVIEECENCDIFLLDHTAAISVDECNNCRVFVGPCETSVFVRTSRNCKFVVAAQQLRVRECRDITFLVYVHAGQPVIEDSSHLEFGPFSFNYFSLRSQFEAAHLSPWNSEWSNVHDFHASRGRNYSFVKYETSERDLLRLDLLSSADTPQHQTHELLPTVIATSSSSASSSSSSGAVGASSSDIHSSIALVDGFVVPKTWGGRPRPTPSTSSSSPYQTCLVAILFPHHDVGYDLITAFQSDFDRQPTPSAFLIRTRLSSLHKSASFPLFASLLPSKNDVVFSKQGVVGMEWEGEGIIDRLAALIKERGWEDRIHLSAPAHAQQDIDFFFQPIVV